MTGGECVRCGDVVFHLLGDKWCIDCWYDLDYDRPLSARVNRKRRWYDRARARLFLLRNSRAPI